MYLKIGNYHMDQKKQWDLKNYKMIANPFVIEDLVLETGVRETFLQLFAWANHSQLSKTIDTVKELTVLEGRS